MLPRWSSFAGLMTSHPLEVLSLAFGFTLGLWGICGRNVFESAFVHGCVLDNNPGHTQATQRP